MSHEERGARHRRWPFVVVIALVIAAALFAAGIWFAGSGARTTTAVLDSYTGAYAGSDSTKDVPVLTPLYAADAVLQDIPADRTYKGATAIKGALDSLLATPKFDLTIERTMIGKDSATVEWTANGTNVGTGRLAQVSGVTVLEMSKGKIVRETWYYDPAKAPF